MPISILFWVLYVLGFLFGAFVFWPLGPTNRWSAGFSLLVYALIGIIGWRAFGPVIQ